MQTITCLINDNYEGTPNPLIYVVEVNDPSDADEVLAAVTQRAVPRSRRCSCGIGP